MSTSWHKDAIAVTGTMGSGKSTVAGFFRDLGAYVIDADELARRAVIPGSKGLEQLVLNFGPEILNPDGTLNRGRLAQIVFADPNQRQTLEKITHPIIRHLAQEEFAKASKHTSPLIVYDCPLLFETGLDQAGFKKIIVVSADEKSCLERVKKSRGINDEQARARLAAQLPVEEKKRRADIIIDNIGTLEDLRQAIGEIWAELTSEHSRTLM